LPEEALPRRTSAEQVRAATFERAPFGRRGYDEVEVQAYLHQVAEELGWRDSEIAQLAGENRQLKHALREWHRQLVGYDAAELVARTQQHIEAQIAQAEAYSREREEEATRRYDEIVAEARRRALAETQRLVNEATAGAGEDEEWLARQQLYAHALLQALDALAAHVHATRQAFTFEISRLGDIQDVGDVALAVGEPPLIPVPDDEEEPEDVTAAGSGDLPNGPNGDGPKGDGPSGDHLEGPNGDDPAGRVGETSTEPG
jgi:DivIVA domain-containing protein